MSTVRIELEDLIGDHRFAEYSVFSVANGTDYYRLNISGYSGDAGMILNLKKISNFSIFLYFFLNI